MLKHFCSPQTEHCAEEFITIWPHCLVQVKGVGTQIALTYVLTIEDRMATGAGLAEWEQTERKEERKSVP
jgi:hypothetical protein